MVEVQTAVILAAAATIHERHFKLAVRRLTRAPWSLCHLQVCWAIRLIFCNISSDSSCSRVSRDRPNWSSWRRGGRRLIYTEHFGLFLLTNAWKEAESFSYLSERLSHLPQEVLGELHGLVQGEIQAAVTDVLLNPARKFPTFVRASVPLWSANAAVTPVRNEAGVQGELSRSSALTHLVCKDHESIVRLASDGSTHTLGSVSHGVEGEKVVLPDLKVIPDVLQTGLFHRQMTFPDAQWTSTGQRVIIVNTQMFLTLRMRLCV